jgi:hypothetical protein
MVRKGWVSIVLKEDLAKKINEKIESEYKEKHKKPQLSTYVQDLLWEVIESEEILRKYGPFLEKFAVEPDKIFIKDNRLDRIAELVLKDGELYCRLDESLNCVHIGFAWSIPEVYKAMELYGKKMPKIE